MAGDTELERLATIQQSAFDRRDRARADMNRAWERRARARDTANGAFTMKQTAYEHAQRCWDNLQATRARVDNTIDLLKNESDRKHNQMCEAFASSQRAYQSGDKNGAKGLSDRGKALRTERNNLNDQVRRAIQQIKREQQAHQLAQADFASKQEMFKAVKTRHEQEKEAHERLKAVYNEAKNEAEQAKQAFHTRLEIVRSERNARRTDYRRIAERAGVPYEYLDSIRVRQDPDGGYNIYFGGVDTPDGSGHGHYAVDSSGHVTYRRNPFDPHGAQNYTSNQSDYFDAVRTETVFGNDEFSFRCVYKGLPAFVETGYDSTSGRQKINIYYGGHSGGLASDHSHGHAIAWRDAPGQIFSDRPPKG